MTASSTTPATSPACWSESHCAGYIALRRRNDTMSSAGTASSVTIVSAGESHNITTSDITSITRLPVSIGRKLNSICTSARSELARDTSCPVGSWS